MHQRVSNHPIILKNQILKKNKVIKNFVIYQVEMYILRTNETIVSIPISNIDTEL